MRWIGAGLGRRGQRKLEGPGPATEDASEGGDIILGIVNQVAAWAEVDCIRIALAEAELCRLAPERVTFVTDDHSRGPDFARLHIRGDVVPDDRGIELP